MIPGLIEEYKDLAAQCAQTDYGNKASVKKHNNAVKRMQDIVREIGEETSLKAPQQFAQLLDVTENKANLWAAIHTLERLKPDLETRKKALSIIEMAAQESTAEAIGYRFWLDAWHERDKHL